MRAVLDADDPVDAIILDALMPGESSHDLALDAKGLRLPVVMISGSPDSMQFAIEHDQPAERATSEMLRLQFLQVARQYEDLAAAVEQLPQRPFPN